MADDLLSYFDESMTETLDLLRKLSHDDAIHLVMQACELLRTVVEEKLQPGSRIKWRGRHHPKRNFNIL